MQAAVGLSDPDPQAIMEQVRTVLFLLPLLLHAATGADVPWTRYEAEDGLCLGAAAVVGPSRAVGDLAGEAARRRAVRLSQAGDGVAWTLTSGGAGLVVRLSIPDAPGGGGQEGAMAVRVDGRAIGTLRATSRHTWLYGPEHEPVDDPAAGPPRRIYDETRLLLPRSLRAGQRLELVRADGPAGIWGLDFAELEPVPVPLACPPDLIDARAAGVDPDQATSQLSSLVARFAAGRPPEGKRGIWLAPGRWRLEGIIRVPRVAGGFVVRGAGMWHTTLVDERGRESDWGSPAFNLDAQTALFADFAILGGGRTRKGSGKPFVNAYGAGSVMRNLWVERMTCGFWVGGCAGATTGLRIEGCRLRNLGADGVNLCNGTRDSVVVDTSVRASGDDGIAIWSAPEHDPADGRGCTGNRIERCTVELPWRAAGIAIYGGGGNSVRDCVVRDTLTYPGLTVSSGFKARAFHGTTLVDGLLLERCGGAFWNGQHFGAIWLQADGAPVTGIDLRGITVREPTFSALQLAARGDRPRIEAAIVGLRVERPGSTPLLVRADAGRVTLRDSDLGPVPLVERHGELRIEGIAE